MKRDLNSSAMNSSNIDNLPKENTNEKNDVRKSSNFQLISSKNNKSNSHYKPIFGKENFDNKNKSQILNFSNVGLNNNTECSFLTCIDNETKIEIKSMMTTMKNEILEMYTNMISEIRKDFRKKCEDVKNVENLVNMKLKKIESIQKEFKEFERNIKEMTKSIDEIQKKTKSDEISISEEYKKQIDYLLSQKTNLITEDYNSLAKFAAKLEDNLKSEFDAKLSKVLKEINHDSFMKILKENSGEFEIKLKSTFEDLNGRIKGFEEGIQNFQKRKEEIFWNVKTDFERKFKEGESYFVTQLSVFKNMLNTKIESKDFKNIMEDIMETKVLELRSDLYVNKNALASQFEEIKLIKEESQTSLDNINSQVKESLNNISMKISQMENLQNSDKNDLESFQEKINDIQDSVEKFKQNFNCMQKEIEQRFIKENEMKLKDIGDIKEISNRMKEKERKTENIISELKKDNQFSKINQLEMLLNELNSNIYKNQDESKNLMESLKLKINTLSIENSRLKERETLLLKELEDLSKKQKIMFSLDHKYSYEAHENKSDTAATTNTNTDYNKAHDYMIVKPNNTTKNFIDKKAFPPEKISKKNEAIEKKKPADLNEILDQFEDYEEENSILSHETENDVFFYPNNNSILSESSKNHEVNPKIQKSNFVRSPSPLLKNPFDENFLENLNKVDECQITNRKALVKKENNELLSNEFQKPEKLPSFRENSFNSKLSSNTNFYDQAKIETIFPVEMQEKKNNRFTREEFDQLMRLEHFFKKKLITSNPKTKDQIEPFIVQNDEVGYMKDENDKYIYDDLGNMIKLTQEQTNYLISKKIINLI